MRKGIVPKPRERRLACKGAVVDVSEVDSPRCRRAVSKDGDGLPKGPREAAEPRNIPAAGLRSSRSRLPLSLAPVMQRLPQKRRTIALGEPSARTGATTPASSTLTAVGLPADMHTCRKVRPWRKDIDRAFAPSSSRP